MRKKVSIINVSSLEGHKDSVYALCGDDMGFIYSGSGDGMVVQWDLSRPKDGVLLAKIDSSIYALRHDSRGFLVIGNNHSGINVIDVATKKELFSVALNGCGAIFEILTDEFFIYVACQNGVLYQIEINNQNLKSHVLSSKSLRSLIFTESGFALGDSNGKLIELNKEFKIVGVQTEAEKSVFGIIENKNQLLSVSRDCHLRIYENQELQKDVVAHMYAVNHIAKKPDELYFATASQDKTIKIWDMENKQLLKVIDQARYNGHSNSVNKLFWSRYGNLLVSCSDDRSVKVWQVDVAENE